MLSNNKLHEGWHVITLQEAFDYVDQRVSHNSLPRDPLRRLCSPLSTRTPSIPTSMSSPSTFMTQDGICLITSWKKGNKDGFQGVLSRAFLRRSPVCGQKCFTCSAPSTYQQHSHSLSCYDCSGELTWLQVISMELHGGIAAKTTSALLTKHLWTVICLLHRAPHHCGVHSGTLGRRLRISQNHMALNVFGK